jgi:N-acetylglucosaminyl-diphospho-decaprenol L-rhamnosyltransferase
VLSVVIVNYRAYEQLTNCLDSLAPFRASADVVVVDHETDARSLQPLSARFPWVRFIPERANPGFAAGVNRGVRETTGEYVLLLNPDCIVASDPRPLASWLAAHPKAAVCGAIVREADGSIQASARHFPGIATGLAGRTTWLTRIWPGNPWTNRNLVRGVPVEPVEVDWVSGACMMVRREAFDAVGGMDEQFFLYWEDADLCRRLEEAGWSTFYHPAMAVTHLTGQSSQHAREASLAAFHESAYRYYRKHGGRQAALLAPVAFLALRARLRLKLAMLRWGSKRP